MYSAEFTIVRSSDGRRTLTVMVRGVTVFNGTDPSPDEVRRLAYWLEAQGHSVRESDTTYLDVENVDGCTVLRLQYVK